jgi:serine/threonine protein phosphatase 1
MNLTYIVGDIHGHLEPLKKLLRQIREDAERRPEGRREVVFLGDYIDRGPSSAEVLRLCHPRKGEDMEALPGFSVVPKIGNHE